MREKILEIKSKAILNHVPVVRDETIKTIVEIIKENQFKNILEIGTAVGFSGIVMLDGSDANLTTVEKNHDRFIEAENNFKMCGFQDRVCQIENDALAAVQNLAQKQEKFDFIFLDGPKGQYIKYLPYLKSLMQEKGILFADNLLLGGLVNDPSRVNHKNRAMVKNMKSFITAIQNDKDFKTEIFDIDDGYSISRLI